MKLEFAILSLLLCAGTAYAVDPPVNEEPIEAAFPNEGLKIAFKDTVPVKFVTKESDEKAWLALKEFWNNSTENVADPITGAKVTRDVVVIKVPLGINKTPVVPEENPITLAKWELGKKLYFDPILSTNNMVACASCHQPEKGFTDQLPVSSGINAKQGAMNAPTILNSGLGASQYWDGRAMSLEEQAQGPVNNPVQMFAGDKNAWQ